MNICCIMPVIAITRLAFATRELRRSSQLLLRSKNISLYAQERLLSARIF